MARKAFSLRKLEITRCDTVTAGANQDARILLFKAAPGWLKPGQKCPKCGQTMAKAVASGEKCPMCGQTKTAKAAPEGGDMPDTEQLAELRKAIDEAVAEATKPLQEQLDTQATEKNEFEAAVKALAEAEVEADPSKIDKAALPEAVRKRLEDLEAGAKADRARVAKMRDAADVARWTGVAKGLDLVAKAAEPGGDAVAELATVLKGIEGSDAPAGTVDRLVDTLTTAQARLSESELFREAGAGGESLGGAEGQLEAAAKALQTKEGLTSAQAYRKAAESNPDLVRKLKEEARA